MLPEYLPGIHPLLVHFPIALLVMAAVADLVALVARRAQVRVAATWLVAVGTAFLPVTYWTGRLSSDMVVTPFPQAEAVMAEHADLAWWTLWAFVAIAGIRLLLASRGRLQGALHGVCTALLVSGVALLAVTAEHGGRLVFDLGVGVRPVREAPPGAFDPEPVADPADLGPVVGDDGALRWRFQEGAAAVLGEFMTASEGELPEAAVESREASLVLTRNEPARTVLQIGAVVDQASIKIRLQRDEFVGTIGLGLHAGEDGPLEFATWDGETVVLGVRRDGRQQELSSAAASAGGWHEFELVAAGTHFRVYLDGELVAHGHDDAAPPGRAAIVLEGTGSVRIDDIRITPISP